VSLNGQDIVGEGKESKEAKKGGHALNRIDHLA